jgi:methionyl-tRNA formyltransferase
LEPLRVITLGQRNHPLTLAALEAVSSSSAVVHVAHVQGDETEPGLRDPNTPSFRTFVGANDADLLVSAGYTQILSPETLEIPRIGAVNVHPSLLPAYRGSHPVYWALYEDQRTVGVTIHEMAAEVDRGPILARASCVVGPSDDVASVYTNLCKLATKLLSDLLVDVARRRDLNGEPQTGDGSYRGPPQREPERLRVDCSVTAGELARRSRIFPGWINLPCRRQRVYVARVEEVGRTSSPAGRVIRRRLDSLDVAVGDGTVARLWLTQPLRSWVKIVLALRGRRFSSVDQLA